MYASMGPFLIQYPHVKKREFEVLRSEGASTPHRDSELVQTIEIQTIN